MAIEKQEAQDFDLPPDKARIAQKFSHVDTRKKREPKAYNFKKPTRKPNATKEGIISELAEFLGNNSQFETSEVNITKPGREITLRICGEWYTVVLTYSRNKNKSEK